MPAGNIINKVRSAFRRDSSDQGFSDTTRFDLSDELEEEETPKFNRLKVVVSGGGDMNGGVAGPGGGGGGGGSSVNTLLVEADDDSLIDSSPGPDGSGLNMDPCDSCSRKRDLIKQKKVMKRLVVAVVLYTLFMIAEIVGGYVSSSLAIMTDAVHLLTDVIGILFSLLALWLSSKPPTNRYTFGLDRLEVVAAVFSVALIYILTAILLFEAVQRTIHQDFEIDGDVMLITAAVGVAVNLVMGFLLNQDGHLHSHGPGGGHGHSHGPSHGSSHGHGHGHGHGHSNGQDHGHSHGSGAHSGSEVVQQKPTGSLAVRAAFIHALGDLVQSVGVLVAAYIVRFKPEYKMADPICTYIFSILVLFTTFRIIRDTFVIVLEGAPKHLDTQMIRDDLLNLDDVQSVEELNVWALTGDKSAALVHLQLAPSSDQNWEEVQAKARHLLLRTYKVTRCTVQVQTHRQRQVRACANCQVPNA